MLAITVYWQNLPDMVVSLNESVITCVILHRHADNIFQVAISLRSTNLSALLSSVAFGYKVQMVLNIAYAWDIAVPSWLY